MVLLGRAVGPVLQEHSHRGLLASLRSRLRVQRRQVQETRQVGILKRNFVKWSDFQLVLNSDLLVLGLGFRLGTSIYPWTNKISFNEISARDEALLNSSQVLTREKEGRQGWRFEQERAHKAGFCPSLEGRVSGYDQGHHHFSSSKSFRSFTKDRYHTMNVRKGRECQREIQ
ncbi:unnamed protein product [Calypogeia fissa]